MDLIKVEEKLKPTFDLLAKARIMGITKPQDIEEAGFVLVKLKEQKEYIEELRKSMTKPLNDSLKAINSFFKKFSIPVEDVDRDLRNRIKEFHTYWLASGKENKFDIATMTLDAKNRVGAVKLKQVWNFKVIDPLKVPSKYRVVDETEVREAIRAGAREISGIEIYLDDQISL